MNSVSPIVLKDYNQLLPPPWAFTCVVFSIQFCESQELCVPLKGLRKGGKRQIIPYWINEVVDEYNVLDGLKLLHSLFSEVHLRPQSI